MMKLKQKIAWKGKKKPSKSSGCPKPGLIFQTPNSWNPRLGLNQEPQFSTNLMLKLKKFHSKKIATKEWMSNFIREKN
jgi:hypothetical protein